MPPRSTPVAARKPRTVRKQRRASVRKGRFRFLGGWRSLLLIGAISAASLLGIGHVPPWMLDLLPAEVRSGVREVQAVVEPMLPDAVRYRYEPVPAEVLPTTPGSWSATRRALYEQVYFDRRETFYCGCAFDGDNRVDLYSCGMSSLVTVNRALRVEAEHVFPASQFGNFRRCWRQPERFDACRDGSGNTVPGRECCMRVDETFVTAHNDLHNLYPAVGHVNARRSNHNWGSVYFFGERYGQCEMRVSPWLRRAEPPEETRGAIARTMLYMRDTYGFRLSPRDERLYQAWNNQYPPDDWERLRNRRIRAIQGVSNPYIESYRKLP